MPVGGTRGRLPGWRKKSVLPVSSCSFLPYCSCQRHPHSGFLSQHTQQVALVAQLILVCISPQHSQNTITLPRDPAPASHYPLLRDLGLTQPCCLQAPEATVQLSSEFKLCGALLKLLDLASSKHPHLFPQSWGSSCLLSVSFLSVSSVISISRLIQ